MKLLLSKEQISPVFTEFISRLSIDPFKVVLQELSILYPPKNFFLFMSHIIQRMSSQFKVKAKKYEINFLCGDENATLFFKCYKDLIMISLLTDMWQKLRIKIFCIVSSIVLKINSVQLLIVTIGLSITLVQVNVLRIGKYENYVML